MNKIIAFQKNIYRKNGPIAQVSLRKKKEVRDYFTEKSVQKAKSLSIIRNV